LSLSIVIILRGDISAVRVLAVMALGSVNMPTQLFLL
jgi:hypothetical protein